MAISEKPRKDEEGGGGVSSPEDGGLDSDFCAPDDYDEDPTFDIVEETRSALSKISLQTSKPRNRRKGVESKSEEEEEDVLVEGQEVKIPELDANDRKCFVIVEKLIKDGQLEKLKIDQCKVYLRKYGLRLTGKKDTLLGRIKEYLEVKDGGGEIKYPVSSFVLNCKGNACTGDVVMFEQKVYENFNIASRCATGPPLGTRIVAGRIVKESYGAAKQQHTFTIEVLWSTGYKPWPPLHPFLIKGRNLYKLKTVRQEWNDENQRGKALEEKYARGSLARRSRENRIQERETRKMGRVKSMKENKSNQEQRHHQVQQDKILHPQKPQGHSGSVRSEVLKQRHFAESTLEIRSSQNLSVISFDSLQPTAQHKILCQQQSQHHPISEKSNILKQASVANENVKNRPSVPAKFFDSLQSGTTSHNYNVQPQQQTREYLSAFGSKVPNQPEIPHEILENSSRQGLAIECDKPAVVEYNHLIWKQNKSNFQVQNSSCQALEPQNYEFSAPGTYGCPPTRNSNGFQVKNKIPQGLDRQNDNSSAYYHAKNHHLFKSLPPRADYSYYGQPFASRNSHWSPPRRQHPVQQRQLCRHYRQGRCHFGEKCKYLHDDYTE